MLKKIAILFFVLVIFFCFTKTSQAHILKYDGDIGAVLHVDPDDDPIAGQPTNFFFEFRDKTNKFVSGDCNCTVTITEEGRELYSSNLFSGNTDPSLTNANFS